MNRSRLVALLGLCLLACSNSGKPAVTQIVITVDSDLNVPDEIDRLTIDVTGLVETKHAKADLTQHDLPRYLTLVHDGGGFGPIRITATGWFGQAKVVEYTTEAMFKMGESVALDIELERACRNYFCDYDKTCKASHCEPIEQPVEPIDTGEPPESDSGTNKPDAATPKDAGPMTVPVDAGKPDAGPKNQAPKCTITSPSANESFTTTEMVPLEGSCSDPESGALPDKVLRWNTGDDSALGLGSALTLPPQPIGTQTFKLCATDPKDSAISGCDQVSISVMLPTAPTAMITDVSEGSTDHTSPFLPAGPLQFTGVGTGEQITYAWTDSFIGDFGSDDMPKLSKPEVGRHRVTLTVTDDVGQTAGDNVTFQVLASGQPSLVQSLGNVNTTLTNGASVLAADSVSQVLAANGTSLYRFDASAPSPTASSAFADPSMITLTTITAISIWEPANLVYLGTSSGLVVCKYTAGASIDQTMCNPIFQGGDLPSNQITSVVRATIGSGDVLVVGTDNGLFVPDDANGSTTGTTAMFTGEPVTAIVASAGFFWFTTAQSGLLYYDSKLDLLRSAANALDGPSLDLTSIAADEAGAIWVGSSKGVGRYEPIRKSWQVWLTGDEPAPGLPSNKVSALATTHVTLAGKPHDVAWIGTNAGVSRLDADVPSFMTLDDADSLPSNDVQAIVVLPADGTKVVATGSGVALYSGR